MRHSLLILAGAIFVQGCSTFGGEQPDKDDANEKNANEAVSSTVNAGLPPIMAPGIGIDKRVYRADLANKGVGGSAQRIPDYIHVLGFEGNGTREDIKRHGQGIALWETRIPPNPYPGVRPDDTPPVAPLYKKYCRDPSSLTDTENERFLRLGGVRSIPRSLIGQCRLNK